MGEERSDLSDRLKGCAYFIRLAPQNKANYQKFYDEARMAWKQTSGKQLYDYSFFPVPTISHVVNLDDGHLLVRTLRLLPPFITYSLGDIKANTTYNASGRLTRVPNFTVIDDSDGEEEQESKPETT